MGFSPIGISVKNTVDSSRSSRLKFQFYLLLEHQILTTPRHCNLAAIQPASPNGVKIGAEHAGLWIQRPRFRSRLQTTNPCSLDHGPLRSSALQGPLTPLLALNPYCPLNPVLGSNPYYPLNPVHGSESWHATCIMSSVAMTLAITLDASHG